MFKLAEPCEFAAVFNKPSTMPIATNNADTTEDIHDVIAPVGLSFRVETFVLNMLFLTFHGEAEVTPNLFVPNRRRADLLSPKTSTACFGI